MTSIPKQIKEKVESKVQRFNDRYLARSGNKYRVRFRGAYAYFDLDEGGGYNPVFRLTYNGDMNSWEFAIYKYSSDQYDPEECFFPGSEKLNGKIEGALRAGLAAYG